MDILKSIPISFRLYQLHAVAVHFPIALLFVAILFYVIARVKNSKPAELLAVGNLVAGTIFSYLAVLSGNFAEDLAPNRNAVRQLLELHQNMGYVVAGFFTLMSLWGVIAYKRPASKIIPLFLLLLMLGGGVLGVQSYIGGYMVYETGLGIHPSTTLNTTPPAAGRSGSTQP